MLHGFKGTRLDQIWNTNQRNPGYRVCIWNPKFDDAQSVVTNRWNGPRYDISQFVETAQVSQNQVFEGGGSAISSRAAFSIRIDDKDGMLIAARRLKIDQKMFGDGTPVVVYEGDTRIAKEDWPVVFTGVVRGFPGAHTAARGQPRRIRVQAFGRAQTFQRQTIVGVNFDRGSDLGDMATETAITELGLTREEIMFGRFDKTVKHKANALTQIGKMEGLNELMKPVQRRPYFDGRGMLVSHDLSLTKPPIWFFREDQINTITRVQNLGQQTNSVEVVGLDSNLSEVLQSNKALNEVDITLGYFESSYSQDIYYSQDKNRRAKNTSVQTKKRPGFGGSASWSQIDDFHGKLTLDTGYGPEVFALIAITWIAAAAFEVLLDLVIEGLDLFGWNPLSDFTKAELVLLRTSTQGIKNAAMLGALITMQRIGRWNLEIYGEPFENVYQELRAIAVRKGTKTADVIERTSTIHWLSTLTECKDMAKNLLRRELVKSQSYEIVCASLPILEVDDIIEVSAPNHGFPRPARFYITSIDRSYSATNPKGVMKVRAWHSKEEMPE
jgi:hypothetical protein